MCVINRVILFSGGDNMIKAALGDIFLQRGLIPFDSHVIKNPPRVFDIKEYSNVARIDRERSEPVG